MLNFNFYLLPLRNTFLEQGEEMKLNYVTISLNANFKIKDSSQK